MSLCCHFYISPLNSAAYGAGFRRQRHNQNPIFTTETRRHGDTEKNWVEKQSQKQKPRTAEETGDTTARNGRNGRWTKSLNPICGFPRRAAQLRGQGNRLQETEKSQARNNRSLGIERRALVHSR